MAAIKPESGSTHAVRPFRSVLCLFVLWFAGLPAAGAEPPAGTIAWATMDAGALRAEHREAETATGWVRALALGVIPGRTAAVDAVVGVVGAALDGGARVEVALVEFAARPGARDGQAEIDRLLLVVRVEGGDAQRMQAAVRAAYSGTTPERTELGVVYRGATAPAWQEVAVAQSPDGFILAVGEGALAGWSEAVRSRTRTAWEVHRGALRAHLRAGDAAAEVFVDANALRAAFPESFAGGRMRRIASAWGVSNARSLMVRVALAEASRGPRPIVAAASFEARSRPPGSVIVEPLVGPSWPAEVDGLIPEGSPWAFVVPSAWSRGYGWAVGAWEASRDGWGVIEFDARRARWERRHMARVQRVFGATRPWAVVTGSGLVAPLGRNSAPARVAADVSAVFETFGERSSVAADGRSGTVRVGAGGGGVLRWSVSESGVLEIRWGG